MPMIYESPHTFDQHSPVPYWLPQNSLGSVITEHSTELHTWLYHARMAAELGVVMSIDYRPTLHRILQSDQFLGVREASVSSAVELIVYLPLLDRLLIEKRGITGLINTSIYRNNTVDGFSHSGLWEKEYECNWRFSSKWQTNGPSYDGVPVDDNLPLSTPSYKTYIFTDSPSSTTNQPQEATMQEPIVYYHNRHPYPHEFSTRIEQGDRMLSRLQHALLVLAVTNAKANSGITIPTGDYPTEAIQAANDTLSRFFRALAVGMPRIVEDDAKFEHYLKLVMLIQDNVVERFANTAVVEISYDYGDLRDLYMMVRDEARKLIHNKLVWVSEQSMSSLFALRFAIEHGRLRNAGNMRIGTMRSLIERLFDVQPNDYDEMREYLHDNGFSECADCDSWEHNDSLRSTYDSDDDVCRSCINNNYTWSDYYDNHVHRDYATRAVDQYGDEVTIHENDCDFHYDDNSGQYRHNEYEYRAELIASYHSTKRHGFKYIESDWVKRNDRFIGVELEIECRSSRYDAVERLNNTLNEGEIGRKVWFENDGSLSDSGFEMITNPMGLDTHAAFWEWLQDKELTRHLRSHDTSTCGLHVHVSRKNLHDLQINRMNVFINHPDNAKLIKAVARRYATNYARIRDKQMGKAHYSIDRYDALNLENDRTVEFRIFKGTLKHESLMSALEFTNAVVNFTNPASPAGFNLSTERFVRFITHPSQLSETRYLRSYLKEAGFMS